MEDQRIARIAARHQHHASLPCCSQILFAHVEAHLQQLQPGAHLLRVSRLQKLLRGFDQRCGANLQNQRSLDRLQTAINRRQKAFHSRERGIVGHTLCLHLREERLRNSIAQRSMFDAVGPDRQSVSDIARIPGVYGDRQLLRARLTRDGLQNRHVQAAE